MARIMVVDDEIQIRELLISMLGMEGHQVVTVPTGEQAVQRLRQETYDLIILDLNLKAESGLSILTKIQVLKEKVPVVIYSGRVTADIEKQARLGGAVEVLNKGSGAANLVSQIDKILSARQRIFHVDSNYKHKRLLIVDDHIEVRRMVSDFFKKQNFDVYEAKDGQQALELGQAEDPAVVLLDINLPDMSGLEVLEKLKEINPKVGVVMMTGNPHEDAIEKAVELGSDGYVIKPVDLSYLELVVLSRVNIVSA